MCMCCVSHCIIDDCIVAQFISVHSFKPVCDAVCWSAYGGGATGEGRSREVGSRTASKARPRRTGETRTQEGDFDVQLGLIKLICFFHFRVRFRSSCWFFGSGVVDLAWRERSIPWLWNETVCKERMRLVGVVGLKVSFCALTGLVTQQESNQPAKIPHLWSFCFGRELRGQLPSYGCMEHGHQQCVIMWRLYIMGSAVAQPCLNSDWPSQWECPFLPREAMLSAVYAVVVCLCVCLSVCPSHSGIVSKRLNVGSRKNAAR